MGIKWDKGTELAELFSKYLPDALIKQIGSTGW
jgi:hypothetical protein